MSDKDDRNKKNYIREFCAKTTIHGLPNIADSNNWCQRLFWILVTIGGVVTCLACNYSLYYFLQNHFYLKVLNLK